MKTALLLLCTSVLAGLTLSSCVNPPEPEPEPLPPREVHHYYHESPAPARPETPEDFRAVTPPGSYSR